MVTEVKQHIYDTRFFFGKISAMELKWVETFITKLKCFPYAFCELQVFVPPKKRRQQYFFIPEYIDKYKVLNTNQK